MRLDRARWVAASCFAFVAATLSIVPLLLWREEREDAIRASLDTRLVGQMEAVLHGEIVGVRVVDYLSWMVNTADGWTDPFTETDVEPPLFTWMREAGGEPDFREFSLDDGQTYRGFVRPQSEVQGYITIASATERDDDLAALQRRALLMGAGLLVASVVLGVVLARLATGSARRAPGDQQSFLADAAHEMRTPLAVILASSSQALARPRSSEEYVRSLSEIRSAAERASTGVNEMLDLVRFESGQMMPRIGPLRLDLLAEEVAASVRPDGVETVAEIIADPADPVVVAADMALLRQAIDNVVRNAARRSTRVELLAHVDGRDGVIDVVDDGPGFDPAVLPRVFERYQRGDRRGEAGIGLAIVKAIATAHGGSVAARNNDGAGATVSIRIPLART
ncbi:MAG: sensor histidine kinase [Actinomycetes bacterium]|jgi:signal transduction histidine kinase|uniref:histidine kinase n=1 Tax=freshwater metagenome TaxID=449393 RepID=A0A6J6D5T8_9ZZZZ|nr:hypothetical protein [Actinomycetota bacterium]